MEIFGHDLSLPLRNFLSSFSGKLVTPDVRFYG